jgi:hypothetical protein
MEKPCMRFVEFTPVVVEGKELLLLADPTGIGREVLLSPAAAQIVLEFFNGQFSIEDVQAIILKAAGSLVPSDKLRELAAALDEAGLLMTEKYAALLEARRKSYSEAPARPALLAGEGYPDGKEDAVAFLDEVLSAAREEGARQSPGARAILAPHIDFARGALAYGFAYEALRGSAAPEVVVVLGTGHHVAQHAFVVTEKDFETPLGTVVTDRALVRRLCEACGPELIADQHEHASEHSIEFQALWLAHLFGDGVKIVPVLCGAFPPPLAEAPLPLAVPEIARFVGALRAIIEELGPRCLVVGGVDFSHVGPGFQGEEPVDATLCARVEAADRMLMEPIVAGDAGEFYARLRGIENRHSVCGFAAVYTLLAAMPGLKGRLLRYEQAFDPHKTVTFAAVAFA